MTDSILQRTVDRMDANEAARAADPAAPISRGDGTRRSFDAPIEDVRSAAKYVMAQYEGEHYRLEEHENHLAAVFEHSMVFMRQDVFLSSALAEGTTQVEAVVKSKLLGYNQRKEGENKLLNIISDTLALQRAAAGKKSAAPDDKPSPLPPKTPVSEVDSPSPLRAAQRQDDFALVIGVEKYQNLPAADWSERDASVFKKYAMSLGVPEENVILLTGLRATRTGLAKYLEEWLPRNVTEKSRVYFYYSGHGAPDPKTGGAYLVPWDGDPSFLETSAYPITRLYEKLGALQAKEVLVLLDACFSGSGGRSVLAKGARPLVTQETAVPTSPKLSILAAASSDEITGSLDDQGHGIFTYYLLKGLKGEADADKDSHLTVSELHAFLQKGVQRAARRQNREQTTQLKAAPSSLQLY